MGSVVGTLADAREMHPELGPVKLIRLRAFRPFPAEALREACTGVSDLVVLDRAISPGGGGILGTEVSAVLFDMAERAARAQFRRRSRRPRHSAGHLPAPAANGRSQTPKAPRFAVFDVDLDKLPPEDR